MFHLFGGDAMSLVPIVGCRRMETSIAFYTRVLDFEEYPAHASSQRSASRAG